MNTTFFVCDMFYSLSHSVLVYLFQFSSLHLTLVFLCVFYLCTILLHFFFCNSLCTVCAMVNILSKKVSINIMDVPLLNMFYYILRWVSWPPMSSGCFLAVSASSSFLVSSAGFVKATSASAPPWWPICVIHRLEIEEWLVTC